MKKNIFLSLILLLIVTIGCVEQQETTQKSSQDIPKNSEPTLKIGKNGNVNYLVIDKDGKETILAEGKIKNQEDPTNISIIKNPRFSPNKNYILYDDGTYFGELTQVYNLKESRIIDRGDVGKTGFSNDGKYFYKCRTGRGGGIEAIVKDVPNFNVVFDVFGKQLSEGKHELNNGFNDLDCSYEKSTQQIKFTLYENWEESDRGNIKILYYPKK
ncbi:hypothetical protein K9N08_03865 [Candidatus Gracilibacteria bacterium]|nr:hypothetical protein [Candidatus Gracilibacteria bacterium]MCF7856658.1 hypothetical protein [Candidatus Gracilibacteria bacterium]MCF7896989.1 hypothetical protein [Candidatus Gracilibacteria bacterium]